MKKLFLKKIEKTLDFYILIFYNYIGMRKERERKEKEGKKIDEQFSNYYSSIFFQMPKIKEVKNAVY